MNKVDSYKGWMPPAFRILVKTSKVEEKTQGGIILTDKLRERQEYSSGEGTVIAIGPTAFDAFEGGAWCKVGDVVKFKSYSGCEFKFLDDDGEESLFRFINDDDIIGVKETVDV